MTDMNPDELRERIRHILGIYPGISPTMLHVGIGPTIPAKKWKPVMETMIETGEIKSENVPLETPSGRYNSYVKLSLTV